MKKNFTIIVAVLAILISGGVIGYNIGVQTTVASIPRSNAEIIADAQDNPSGADLGKKFLVTKPDVFVEEPGGTYANRCSIDYGGELTKISDLPNDYNKTMNRVHFTSSADEKIILMHYLAPEKTTGRLLASTPVCNDDIMVSGPADSFADASDS